jgi:hypothetical protein
VLFGGQLARDLENCVSVGLHVDNLGPVLIQHRPIGQRTIQSAANPARSTGRPLTRTTLWLVRLPPELKEPDPPLAVCCRRARQPLVAAQVSSSRMVCSGRPARRSARRSASRSPRGTSTPAASASIRRSRS